MLARISFYCGIVVTHPQDNYVIFARQNGGIYTLRREIHEGLNVMENWNSATNFILYGRHGEFSTNRHEGQELTMLSLHLLQASLVYIQTLLFQQLLADPVWMNKMTKEDLRALTPLIYANVNPYGTIHLDLAERLEVERAG